MERRIPDKDQCRDCGHYFLKDDMWECDECGCDVCDDCATENTFGAVCGDCFHNDEVDDGD